MSEGVSEAHRSWAVSQAELLGMEMYDLGLTEPLILLERVCMPLSTYPIQDRGEMLPIFFLRRGRAKTLHTES